MNKAITKKYTFSAEEINKLQNIEIGLINARATAEGLSIYKDVTLMKVYKRLNINTEPKKGFKKSIQYSLSKNEIVLTEEPEK